MFISWISQLVAVLDKPEGPAIHNVLFSIARDYPQALYYPLKISKRGNNSAEVPLLNPDPSPPS